MRLLTETVPKSVYDDLLARYDALLEKYHSLRQMGHAPVTPAVVIPPRPDSGQLAVMGAELALANPNARKLVDELIQKGYTEPAALREVQRMQDIGRGRTLPPQAGT